jgi:hypothetical protein
LILTSLNYDFGSRPPLEVKVRVADSTVSRDLYIIILHMKALTDIDSYNRRKAAAVDLKSYLDTTRAGESVMVVGDWNDDVDVSILSYATCGMTTPCPTPYDNFIADPTNYRFATKELSDTNQRTTVSYSSTIDHQLLNLGLFNAYVTGSSTVTKPAIANYSATTTDHYPVTTHYVFH